MEAQVACLLHRLSNMKTKYYENFQLHSILSGYIAQGKYHENSAIVLNHTLQ